MKALAPLSIAALLLLTACGTTTESPAAEPAPVSSAAESSATEPSVAASEDKPGFTRPAEFGETATFPVNLSVSVTSNGSRPVTEDDGIVSEPGDMIVGFTVEVENNAKESRLEPGMLEPSLSFGEGFGESGTLILNSDLGPAFPGETVKGDFERMMPADQVDKVRISIADPSFSGPDAVFEGSLK